MDGLTATVYQVIEGALSILPDSPFNMLENISSNPMGEWLGWVNWFVPVNSFLVILELWVSAILVYYVIQIALRWAKAIE